jgi:hypothetical protein
MWKFYIVTGRLSRKHAFVRRWSHAWTGPRPAAAGIGDARGTRSPRFANSLRLGNSPCGARAAGPRRAGGGVRVAAEAAYFLKFTSDVDLAPLGPAV